MRRKQTMQRCSIWTVSLAAALSLTGAAWADHEGGGGHGPAAGHGTTPTFAKQRQSDEAHEARESHSGARNSGIHSAGATFSARLMTRLANDPTLAAQLKSLLPMGMSPTDAAKGFRNLNQLLTALNVAKDQSLDFGKLQQAIMGGDSLAQAILDQKPTLDAKTVIMTARTETKADLKMVRAAEEAAEDKEKAADKAEDAKEKAADKAEDAKEKAAAGATFAARLMTRLANDPTLAAQLKSLLPTGMSPTDAAKGFRNL